MNPANKVRLAIIVISVLVLAAISALCIVIYIRQQSGDPIDGRMIWMHNVEQALDAYRIRHGTLPSTEEGLKALVTQRIMKELPKDAWGNEFIYERHDKNSYTLKSLGADGKTGGSGDDEDLVLEGLYKGRSGNVVDPSRYDDDKYLEMIIDVPRSRRFPGSRALEHIEREIDISRYLKKNWHNAESQYRDELLSLWAEYSSLDSERRYYRLTSKDVVEEMVNALDSNSKETRSHFTRIIEKNVDEKLVREFSSEIVRAVKKHGNTEATRLLGRTRSIDAVELLMTDDRFSRSSRRTVELALAKLGDEELQKKFVDNFRQEEHPKKKSHIARDLAYIGTELTCRALAEDLRSSLKVQAGATVSLRVRIIDALCRAYPDEEVLRPPKKQPRDDSYYEQIEKWAEKKFGIKWKNPRPPFFYGMPGIHRAH